MKDFSKLCTPARIYFAIAVVAAVIALFNGATLMAELMKLVFAFIWTYLLGWLCSKGYESVSWFLVLLPYIFILLATLNIYHQTEEQRQLMRAMKMQGAFGREPFKFRKSADKVADKIKEEEEAKRKLLELVSKL